MEILTGTFTFFILQIFVILGVCTLFVAALVLKEKALLGIFAGLIIYIVFIAGLLPSDVTKIAVSLGLLSIVAQSIYRLSLQNSTLLKIGLAFCGLASILWLIRFVLYNFIKS